MLSLELPIQLSGAAFSPPIATSAAGHAWIGYDEDCRLHYEIAVTGLQNEENHAYAQMGYYNAGSAQVSRMLAAFRGDLVRQSFTYFFLSLPRDSHVRR